MSEEYKLLLIALMWNVVALALLITGHRLKRAARRRENANPSPNRRSP